MNDFMECVTIIISNIAIPMVFMFFIILVGSGIGKILGKLGDASAPDDPTDPEPTAEDFLGLDPDRYLEFEDEYLAAGGNDNPDTETF
jgi:hypothetical protein